MPMENHDDKKRRMTPTSIDSLSDDDLITILLKLPAQDLHDAGRLVCRRWYHLICSPEFTHTHLQSSPAGILIWCHSNEELRPAFMGMSQQGQIETYKLHFNFKDIVLSSCNGLILLCDPVRHRLSVANPATKQHCFIPPPIRKLRYFNRFTCLGYVTASMEYKLVHVNNPKQCAVLTMGVDHSWRHLPAEHFCNGIIRTPVATEGFAHWVTSSKKESKRLVTLDLEAETISDVPFPEGLRWFCCFSAGKCLSLVNCSWPNKYCWEVWEMRPGPVAEWNKLPDIDMEGKKGTHENLWPFEPIGWIKYKEVLLFEFCSSSKLFAYNVCTKGIELFDLDFPCLEHRYAPHINSLVRF